MGWIQYGNVARIGAQHDGDSSLRDRSGVRLAARLIAAFSVIGAIVVVVVATAASGAPLGNEQSQTNPPSEDSPRSVNIITFASSGAQ